MKKLTTILLSFYCSALCASAESTNLNQEIWKLSNEKRKLTMKVSSAIREHNLSEDPRLKEAQEKAYLASRELVKAKKNHPDLKAYIAKSDAAQDKMIDAAVAKDDEAKKAARKEFTEARVELEKAAGKLPEIQEIQKKAIAVNKQAKETEIEVLSGIPEGKELVDQIKALDKKIAELQAQLKAN